MDETSVTVRGQWRARDRAVDKMGQTRDALLTEERDEQAAKRLLTTASRRHGGPETSTIDGRAANEAALKSDKEAHGTASASGQVKSLNTIIDQDQRGVQRVTRPL